MKTPIGIFLLICMTLPYVGTYSWLAYERHRVREEVKERMLAGLQEDELVLLKFTLTQTVTELSWEHAREFEYKGEMYDVVEKEVRGDSVFFWCWRDREETDLNRRIEALIEQESNDTSPAKENRRNFDNLLQSPFLVHSSDWSLPLNEQPVFSEYLFTLCSIPHPPVAPPPKRA